MVEPEARALSLRYPTKYFEVGFKHLLGMLVAAGGWVVVVVVFANNNWVEVGKKRGWYFGHGQCHAMPYSHTVAIPVCASLPPYIHRT